MSEAEEADRYEVCPICEGSYGRHLDTCRPARFRRIDGSSGWVRDDPYVSEDTGRTHTIATQVVGRGDTSDRHVIYPGGYDSRCGWCWLGATHSTDAHTAKIK